MKQCIFTLGTIVLLCFFVQTSAQQSNNFETDAVGQTPSGFTSASAVSSQAQDWKVANDNGNKVVAQLAKNTGNSYNLLVKNEPVFVDFVASVKIKAIAGTEDQGGGLVWRYIDSKNYYIARYNPLEKNLRFYRVVNGNREQLETSENNTVGSNEWFTLTIEMKGNTIACSLNGKKLIEAKEETFKKAGKIGFWSKADAQSYFDDLNIQVIN
jgi:hypothetical protein